MHIIYLSYIATFIGIFVSCITIYKFIKYEKPTKIDEINKTCEAIENLKKIEKYPEYFNTQKENLIYFIGIKSGLTLKNEDQLSCLSKILSIYVEGYIKRKISNYIKVHKDCFEIVKYTKYSNKILKNIKNIYNWALRVLFMLFSLLSFLVAISFLFLSNNL